MALTTAQIDEAFPNAGMPEHPTPYQLVNSKKANAVIKELAAANSAVFYPPTDDYTGILLAGYAAEQNGGGIVQLKPIAYTLTGALPLLKNVMYRGSGAPWHMFGHLSISGGTRLIGDAVQDEDGRWVNGSFNCFEHNTVDRASPYAVAEDLKLSEVYGAGVSDLIMEQFAYGIKAGALHEGGAASFRIDNVVALRCSEWGYWLENMEAMQGGTITAMDCQKGQICIMASGGPYWNYGDSFIKALFGQAPRGSTAHMRSRGIVVGCRGNTTAAGDLNDVHVAHIGINGLNTTYTSAVTITSGSADIAVPDLEMFGVDSAVYFSSTVGNFVAGRTYFVVQVSGETGAGTIRLAQYIGGPAFTASASGTPTINNNGYTLVELGGRGDVATSTGTLTYCTFPHIDAESNGTAGIVVQKAKGTYVRSNSTVGNQGVVMRELGRYNLIHNESSSTALDCDDNSKKSRYTGVKPIAGKIKWNMPIAMVFDDSITGLAFYMSGLGANEADIWVHDNTWPAVTFGRAIKHKYNTFPGNYTWEKAHGDIEIYTGSGGNTITLPAITDNMTGIKCLVSNPGAGSLTVATTSSQAIIAAGTSATSYTMTTLTNATFVACKTGSTFYWARY